MKIPRLCIGLLAAAFSVSCVTVPLDRSRSLGKPAELVPVEQVPVHGFLVEVELGDKKPEVQGELLAVDEQFIWVLVAGEPVAIDRSTVQTVEILELFPSGAAETAIWTTLGALSTLSHGAFLIISAPAWLLVGIPLSVAAARANDIEFTPAQFHLLYQWARYPQGIPLNPKASPQRPEAGPPAG